MLLLGVSILNNFILYFEISLYVGRNSEIVKMTLTGKFKYLCVNNYRNKLINSKIEKITNSLFTKDINANYKFSLGG